jgi:hypothetical protein
MMLSDHELQLKTGAFWPKRSGIISAGMFIGTNNRPKLKLKCPRSESQTKL